MTERFETFTVLISKISRNVKKIKNHEMSDYNLKSPHVSCLYYLYCEESLTATELCQRCEEDKATISRSLDYLEKNDYLICNDTCAKRYKSYLSLTQKGKEAGKKISDKINNILDSVGTVLSEDERNQFYKSLTAISNHLNNMTESLN